MKIEIQLISDDINEKGLSVHETIFDRKAILLKDEVLACELHAGRPIILEAVDIRPRDPSAKILSDEIKIGDGGL